MPVNARALKKLNLNNHIPGYREAMSSDDYCFVIKTVMPELSISNNLDRNVPVE